MPGPPRSRPDRKQYPRRGELREPLTSPPTPLHVPPPSDIRLVRASRSSALRNAGVFWLAVFQRECEALTIKCSILNPMKICLLYTSDAADDLLCVDLGGRR